MPGSGKTTAAKSLSTILNIPWFDLDQLIEEAEGRSIKQIFKDEEESGFRQIEARLLKEFIKSESKFILACGGGTPCFLNSMGLMNESGTTVFLDTPRDVLIDRLKKSEGRPLVNKANEINQYVDELSMKRMPFYKRAQINWDSTGSVKSLVELLRGIRS